MATDVKLPDLGDGIESGDVLEIFVSEGEVITEGQDIIEMETDKATVPVPSPVGGKVVGIAVSEGDTVEIGGVLLSVEAESGAAADEPAATAPPPSEPAEPVEPSVPEATTEAPAPEPEHPAVNAAKPEPPTVPATPPVGSTSPNANGAPPTTPAPTRPAPVAPSSPAPPDIQPAVASSEPSRPSGTPIPAGPSVRRFAREVGVNLANVSGTGDGGRITRDDVLAVVRATSSGSAPATAANPSAATATATAPAAAAPRTAPEPKGVADNDDHGPVRIERMSKIRKTIARQMNASWTGVPRVTNFDDADVSELERLRQGSKAEYAEQGLKLTTMPFLIKAVATALKHHPAINAVVDEANEQIIYKQYVNVGIAVDTDDGLLVPVMKDTDQMSIPDITRSLASMAAKVRGGNTAISDLRGGTFTISNLGAIGGQYATPIVNIPEVAILLVGRSRKMPVVMPDETIQPRLMMPLSLSYDHRLVDGGTAARFLNDVIGYLESPSRLLMAL